MPVTLGVEFLADVPRERWQACAVYVGQQIIRFDDGPCWDALEADFRIIERWTKPPAPVPPRPPVPPEDPSIVLARVQARSAVCEGCEYKNLIRTVPGTDVVEVYCTKQRGRCSCPNGEVRLDYGRCPESKWPKPGGE